MSRLVELKANGPRKLDADDLDEQKGDVAICQCGLAETFPFCDGSHRQTRDEAPDQRYVYDEDGTRAVVDRIVRDDDSE